MFCGNIKQMVYNINSPFKEFNYLIKCQICADAHIFVVV